MIPINRQMRYFEPNMSVIIDNIVTLRDDMDQSLVVAKSASVDREAYGGGCMEHQNTQNTSQLGDELGVFVQRALALTAGEIRKSTILNFEPHPLPQLVQDLTQRSFDACPDALSSGIERMLANRFPLDMIEDVYLPAVANRLGAAWVADEMSFGQVSIGSSRLQSLLRRIDETWGLQPVVESEPSCLVVLPAMAQHTLGPTLLARQLRRRGVNVQLELSATELSIKRLMSGRRYDAVFVSAGRCDDLDTVAGLVDNVREYSGSVPIVTGGGALSNNPELRAITGADYATVDVNEAMQFCNLSERTSSVAKQCDQPCTLLRMDAS